MDSEVQTEAAHFILDDCCFARERDELARSAPLVSVQGWGRARPRLCAGRLHGG